MRDFWCEIDRFWCEIACQAEATCSDLVQKHKFCSFYNLVQKQKFIAFFDSKAHVSNAAQQKFCSVYNLVEKRKFIAFFDSKAHVSNAAQHFWLIQPSFLKCG